jgi:hypothetical protein
LRQIVGPHPPGRACPHDPAQAIKQYLQMMTNMTIQTAAEAVAWSFGLAVEDYHPAQEP